MKRPGKLRSIQVDPAKEHLGQKVEVLWAGATLRFCFANGFFIDVKQGKGEGALDVRTSELLSIEPSSSNAVQVRVKSW